MTKPTSLLSLPMFYFFVLYKQWQRNLKLTSISNLKNFLGGGAGGAELGNVLWEFENGQWNELFVVWT